MKTYFPPAQRCFSAGVLMLSLGQLFTAHLNAATLADQTQTTVQPSLALNYFVDPINGFVDVFAGNFTPGGELAANGQLLSIASQPDLFNIIGTQFGGDGVNTFALPNLNGTVGVGVGQGPGFGPVDSGQSFGTPSVSLTSTNYPTSIGGSQQPFTNEQPSLGLHYIIATRGVFPFQNGGGVASNTLAFVTLFAGAVAPNGWAFADGSLLPINTNQALFSLLGTNYGGNGTSNFALPDLRDRTVIGVGAGAGLTPRTIADSLGTQSTTLTNANLPIDFGGTDSAYSNMQPSMALGYFISPLGIYPPRDGTVPIDLQITPLVAQVVMFAGNFTPNSWLAANGALVPIGLDTALFSLLGTQFGGNGISNFALPDLRGRDIVGADPADGYFVGDSFGVESLNLADNVVTPPPTPVPEPATMSAISVLGLALLGRHLRRLRVRAV